MLTRLILTLMVLKVSDRAARILTANAHRETVLHVGRAYGGGFLDGFVAGVESLDEADPEESVCRGE